MFNNIYFIIWIRTSPMYHTLLDNNRYSNNCYDWDRIFTKWDPWSEIIITSYMVRYLSEILSVTPNLMKDINRPLNDQGPINPMVIRIMRVCGGNRDSQMIPKTFSREATVYIRYNTTFPLNILLLNHLGPKPHPLIFVYLVYFPSMHWGGTQQHD